MQDSPKPSAIVSTIKPRRDALLVALLVMAVTTFSNIIVYALAARGLLDEIQDNLRNLATIASQMTDGDLHQTITRPEQKNSPAYMQVNAPYRMLLKAVPKLRYVYTVVEKDDKLYFILDTQPESNANNPNISRKTTAEVMEEYPDATDAMRTAIAEKRIVIEDEAYDDEWGSFISGYAPIYDSKRDFVGIVGVDIDATDFNHEMFKVRLGLLIGTLIGLSFSCAVGYALYQVRKEHAQRSLTRQRLLEQTSVFYAQLRERISAITEATSIVEGKTNTIAEVAEQSAHRTQEAQATIRGATSRFQSISTAADRLRDVISISKTAVLTEEGMSVIEQQEEVVGFIAADIDDVTERTKTIVAMVKSITDMATTTSTQTTEIHKAMSQLHDQTSRLRADIERFIQKIGL